VAPFATLRIIVDGSSWAMTRINARAMSLVAADVCDPRLPTARRADAFGRHAGAFALVGVVVQSCGDRGGSSIGTSTGWHPAAQT